MMIQCDALLQPPRRAQRFLQQPAIEIVKVVRVDEVVGFVVACQLCPLMAQANQLQVLECRGPCLDVAIRKAANAGDVTQSGDRTGRSDTAGEREYPRGIDEQRRAV